MTPLAKTTLAALKATLEMDSGLTAEDRAAYMDMLRHPEPRSKTAGETRKYLSPKSVAKMLDVTLRTIHRWINDGSIQSVKLNGSRRIPQSSIDRLSGGHRTAYGQEEQ